MLSKAYIKTALKSPTKFKQILAITFTNKAVNEMKQRILNSLFEFSKTKLLENASSMFLDVMEETKMDVDTLQQKSKTSLKRILHNYAFFDISTIDKFTHRLIRTFAIDLKLPQNFEVVLDTDLLLGEAIANLIYKAGEDQQITKILIDFAIEKIDDDKSWDITFDLNKIGKLLFNENETKHLKSLVDIPIHEFLNFKTQLQKEISLEEKKITLEASNTLSFIEEMGFEFSDFPRETLPNHFKKITEGNYSPTTLYNNKLEQNLIDNKIIKATVKKSSDEIAPKILSKYQYIKELVYKRAQLINVYKNLVPLTVINTIQKEIKNIQTEQDLLSISEFNTIISNEVKDQPAPFIYERLGEKYRHYFIDEFQDTSEMQWCNLIPLIGNALESEDENGNTGSVFLVGDAKQAIYRWRGGKAEQFLNLVNAKTNPFVFPPEINNLPSNYRSHEEIIKFNNDFFTITSPLLNNPFYQDLFIKGNQQKSNAKKGGFVEIKFLDEKENIDEHYCNEVLVTIQNIVNKKYAYNDICILTRKHKHGVLLADFLMRSNIPIISPDTLLLKNNSKVNFLVNVVNYIVQPTDKETIFNILLFLSKENDDRSTFIHQHLTTFDTFLKEKYDFNPQQIEQFSIYDGLEYAIKKFDLVDQSDAYITHFMDVVLETEQKLGSDAQSFISYWEKKKDKIGISAPENVNAVQIMTIHKSKGLEFPIVIFPYANSYIYEEIDPKLWIPNTLENFNQFSELLISKKKEVQNYSTEALSAFNEEHHKLELDAFNLLYVALTRAIKGLYIITFKDTTAKGELKKEYYSGLFIQYLIEKGLWDNNNLVYTMGELSNNNVSSNPEQHEGINFTYSHKEKDSFKILTKSGMLWDTNREEALFKGNLLHNILSQIEIETDIDTAFENSVKLGDISAHEAIPLKETIYKIVLHPKLSSYYSSNVAVYNEKEIITKDGIMLRPDRIVLINNQVTLIDYKTGQKNKSYHQQLFSYADALVEMGFEVENKIIVYINEQVTPEFI